MGHHDARLSPQVPGLEPIELAADWDPGAPSPVLIQEGNQAAICYYADRGGRESPSWEARIVEPSRTIQDVGVIVFRGCYSLSTSAHGTDERERHPLWSLGLSRVRPHLAFEITSSPLVAEYTGFRGGRQLRHFALLFPDLTMEFLAETYSSRTEHGTVMAIAQSEILRLADPAT